MRLEFEEKTSDIESDKFEKIIKAVGHETLMALSNQGLENQAKMLEGLG